MKARALAIVEGLREQRVPTCLGAYVVSQYTHLMDNERPVQIVVFEVDRDEVYVFGVMLSRALAAREYYAHIVVDNELIIVFPECLCLASRGDRVSFDRARAIGAVFGVPQHQMPFESMLDVDHPNAKP